MRSVGRRLVAVAVGGLMLGLAVFTQPTAALAGPPYTNAVAYSENYAPASASTPALGRVDVFKNYDGHLDQKYWTAGAGWSNWTNVGEPAVGLASQPTATWTADGSRLDVFVTGGDLHLYQKTWTAAGWQPWVNLGGTLESAPSASWTGNGSRIDVFAIGSDFRLYQRYWVRGGVGWSNWFGFSLPAAIDDVRSPTVTWKSNGSRLDVFIVGEVDYGTNHLYQLYWTAATGWRGFVDLGAGWGLNAPSATWSGSTSRLDVFGVGQSTDNVTQKYINTQGGWTTFDLGRAPITNLVWGPSGTWTQPGSRLDVFMSDQEGYVSTRHWTSAGWTSWQDIG